jgi:hypothetical protein
VSGLDERSREVLRRTAEVEAQKDGRPVGDNEVAHVLKAPKNEILRIMIELWEAGYLTSAARRGPNRGAGGYRGYCDFDGYVSAKGRQAIAEASAPVMQRVVTRALPAAKPAGRVMWTVILTVLGGAAAIVLASWYMGVWRP